MSEPIDWKPTASIDTLKLRARLMAAIRRFFESRGYWEVDTPILSEERVIDPHLEPFVAIGDPEFLAVQSTAARRILPRYLQTSPEFAMKRLLSAGADAIYQVAHVFRFGESGRLHNPEFAMVEWYRVGDTHHDQMQVVEDLVREVCGAARPPTGETKPDLSPAESAQCERGAPPSPFLRTTYREAFRRHAGFDAMQADVRQRQDWAETRGLPPPPGLRDDDRDGWLNWILAEVVEHKLGRDRPEFVYDYPASQAALARIRPENPPVAERFELYWRGVEVCNGYHELGDADEIRTRIGEESRRRLAEGFNPLPEPARFLASTRAGLPECSGVALGFDRLLMLVTGAATIAEVIPFPFDRA